MEPAIYDCDLYDLGVTCYDGVTCFDTYYQMPTLMIPTPNYTDFTYD